MSPRPTPMCFRGLCRRRESWHCWKGNRSDCRTADCCRAKPYQSTTGSQQSNITNGETLAVDSPCQHFQPLPASVVLGPSELCQASIQTGIEQWTITGRRIDYRFNRGLNGASLENLTHLTVSGNKNRDPRSLRRFLSKLPTKLQHLDLSWNGLTAKSIAHLARKSLCTMKLERISLSGNPLGDVGIKALVEEGHLYRIPSIDLSDCDCGDDGVLFLGRAMQRQNAQMQRLILDMCGIGTVGIEFLSDGIAACGLLKTLEMRCNNIDCLGMAALSRALKHSSVENLNLRANQLGLEGAELLASVLNDTQLRQLHLCHNGIGDEGARYLCEALKTNTLLEELSLSSNRLTSHSTRSFVRTLERNSTLKRLQLQGNMIDRRDVLELVRALQRHNRTLTELTVLDPSYDNHLVNNRLAVYLDANAGGRHFWGDISVPVSAWIAKMKKMAPMSLYWFLQERPDIVCIGMKRITS